MILPPQCPRLERITKSKQRQRLLFGRQTCQPRQGVTLAFELGRLCLPLGDIQTMALQQGQISQCIAGTIGQGDFHAAACNTQALRYGLQRQACALAA